MKKTTKYMHLLIKAFKLEQFFIKLSSNIFFFKRFIPLHTMYNKGFLKKIFRNNSWFYVDVSDYMQWYIWADLEDLSWKKAVKYTKDNISVIDIGANVGAFSIQLANNIDNNIRIYAFEPNLVIAELLDKNIALNNKISDKIIVNKVGLADKKDKLNFLWGNSNSGGGRFVSYEDNNTEQIDVISLDEFVEKNNIKDVSFIKIDVEGYEPFVLQGAKKTIINSKPTVYIEVSPDWWNDKGFSVGEVLVLFKNLDYKFYYERDCNNPLLWDEVKNINTQCNLLLLSV